MQTKMLSRFLSVLLVLALTAGLVPAAWAAGGVPSESGRDSSDWSLFPSARVDGVTLDRDSLSLWRWGDTRPSMPRSLLPVPSIRISPGTAATLVWPRSQTAE